MITFIKRFAEWLHIKTRIDGGAHKPPLFNEREIWWCSVGENIGVEISGKGTFFRRPVLILKKLDSFSCMGLPLSRTQRKGSWFISLEVNGVSNTIILSQIRHFDYRRMDKRMGILREDEFEYVRNEFVKLFLK